MRAWRVSNPDPRLRRPLLYPTELQAQSRKIRSLILSFQTASEGKHPRDRYKLYHQQGRLSSTFLRLTEIFAVFGRKLREACCTGGFSALSIEWILSVALSARLTGQYLPADSPLARALPPETGNLNPPVSAKKPRMESGQARCGSCLRRTSRLPSPAGSNHARIWCGSSSHARQSPMFHGALAHQPERYLPAPNRRYIAAARHVHGRADVVRQIVGFRCSSAQLIKSRPVARIASFFCWKCW